MFLEIAINTHNYDRRLCWTLSSLLQQTAPCEYAVMMSYVPGTLTEQVIGCFKAQGMRFTAMIHQPDCFAVLDRGNRRTQMIRAATAEWIALVDSDNVYSPDFLQKLTAELKGIHLDSPHCLVPYRQTTQQADVDALVDARSYPCVVPDAFKTISGLPLSGGRCNLGAGYCHILNVPSMMEKHGGLYQPEDLHCDRVSRHGPYKTRSDKVLRRKTGWRKLRPHIIPYQIHLQHQRGNYDVIN
jgi:hypothetical protein